MAIYQSDGGEIRQNTCWQNGLRSPAGELSVLGDHHAIHNNILVPRDGALGLNIRERNDYPVDFGTIAADHNLVWAPTHQAVFGWGQGDRGTVAEYQAQNPGGWGSHALQADPLLADPGSANFALTTGSPAIDSGDDSNAPAFDVLDATRPWDGDNDTVAVSDRGAFEFGSPAGQRPDATIPDAALPEGGVGDGGGNWVDGGVGDGGGNWVDAGTDSGNDNGGCDCQTGGAPGLPVWLLALLLVGCGRRRRI